jgi:hypothetical protein
LPGRTARDAFNAYAEPLKAVFRCITTEPLRRIRLADQPNENGIPLEHFFFANAPVRLKARQRNYALHFDQYYRVVWIADSDFYKVTTQSYSYVIEDGETKKELFVFHWHPHSKVTAPHVHIGFGLQGHGLPIDNKAHIPTGRVPVEDIVSFLIHDLNVEPLCDNTMEIIARARERFIEHKSW